LIPGNDDAIRSITLVTSVVADAIREGQGLAGRDLAERTGVAEPEPPPPPEPEIAADEDGAATAAVAEPEITAEESSEQAAPR
jgi:ribosomal protein S2